MKNLLLAVLMASVGVAWAADVADEIREWEVKTGGLPRDPAEKVVEAPSGMKLILCIGQSNMAGRAEVSEEDRKPLDRVLKLNRDDQWVAATSPFHYDRKAAGIGPANAFVKRYLADHPGVLVGIVPCAVGGSKSATWEPEGHGKVGANFRRALSRAKAARAKGEFVAILWHQGESDAGKPTEELRAYYPQRFARMIAAFRKEVGDVPVIVGEIGRFMKDESARINPVLNSLPASVSSCLCVSSEGLAPRDRWHFDLRSANELGERYYAAFRKLESARDGVSR